MAGHEIEKGEVQPIKPMERLHDDIRKENEKDCTDQLIECTVQCDTDDSECKTECVEEYQECELPWEDEEQMTNEHDEGELISEILQIAALLGGTVERTQTLNSVGRSSNKIIIEYNVKHKDET
tara:strand:- start:15 stop:386 length:372 start_codon:yes stop_codon:yes gene_type:complete